MRMQYVLIITAGGGNMVAFANHATADECEASLASIPDVNDGLISQTFTDSRVAARLLGRVVFFTLLNDRDARDLSIAPILHYVDHISGNGFFVRSSLQQDHCFSRPPHQIRH
ncbi:hypothetical protein AX14_001825 [Amanita brunnescens Koide BX004]|nr:hypothetical protein AX14_001825 [Amanita brunnescens Koide BX004]